MSIPLPARAGCLLCPCRSTYFMVSAHEGRREPQAHTDLCICEHKYDNHLFIYVPDPANPSPSNIKGPNCGQQCGCKRKSPRGVQLVTEYWAAITTEGCPDWPANTANGNYAFRACYDFLKATSPSRFREIGSLACFLLAADFSYTGVVQPPTATEVGEIIRGINKGGVRGLELLGLVREREHGNGRAFKMGNADEIKAAFCRLYGFLNNKLSAAQKAHIVFDALMTENSLCKLTRVAGDKADEFKV
ncbi:hypothetical protein C8R47DRAFT_1229446 [Mycena vitilis]|nr:hypothetical protein C8R47DRAFT_1229446 [Mycena vitilis]